MIKLREQIDVKASLERAFKFVEDFTSVSEWDPQVVSAKRITDGPIGVGSRFDVVVRMGIRALPITYEITECNPMSKIVLLGIGKGFRGEDRIFFQKKGDGTRITYEADLEFWGTNTFLGTLIKKIIEPVGKKAVLGLQQCLNQTSGPSTRSFMETLSDRLIVPSLIGFSEIGYQARTRSFPPIDDRLDGRVVVIPGATSGLGKATAFAVADLGATVALVGRDKSKLEEIKSQLEQRSGRCDFKVFQADLAEPSEVVKLGENLCNTYPSIAVLIHNAGVLEREFHENSLGMERSLAVNLIAPYLLTYRLRSNLKGNPAARIILVASGGMYPVKLNIDELHQSKKSFNGIDAYAQAKRAQVILAEVWAEEFKDDHIVVHSMHPGWAETPGVEKSLPQFYRITKPILRSPEHGADTIIWLATASEPARCSGKFWHDRIQRSTYLLPGTKESTEIRKKLLELLSESMTHHKNKPLAKAKT